MNELKNISKLAYNSNVKRHKHICVITDKRKKIISIGINKLNKNNKKLSIHAEHSALLSLTDKQRNSKNLTMYIIRIKNSDHMTFKYSMPCSKCKKIISKYSNIKKIYYSV